MKKSQKVIYNADFGSDMITLFEMHTQRHIIVLRFTQLHTAIMQTAPLLMGLVVINHIRALDCTAKPPSIENKTRAQ